MSRILSFILVSVISMPASATQLWMRASVEKTIEVDGLTRKYLVYVPKGADGPLPLVLAFHGGGGKPIQMERYSRFNGLAEKEKFVVAYPEAVDGNWNDGRGVRFIPDDGTTTVTTIYPAGRGGARVQIYVVKNGGHAWPGRRPYLPEQLIGKTSQDFDASQAIWEFFKLCPPRANTDSSVR